MFNRCWFHRLGWIIKITCREDFIVDVPEKYQKVCEARKNFAEKNKIIESVINLPSNYFKEFDETSIIMDGVSDSPSSGSQFRLLGTCKILKIPCGCYFYGINTSIWKYDEDACGYIATDYGDDDEHHFKDPTKNKGYFIRDCTACSIAAGYIGSGLLVQNKKS